MQPLEQVLDEVIGEVPSYLRYTLIGRTEVNAFALKVYAAAMADAAHTARSMGSTFVANTLENTVTAMESVGELPDTPRE